MKLARIAALLIAALSPLITGCGSDEDDAPSPSTTTPPPPPPSAAPPAASAVAGPGVTVSWQAPVQNEDGSPLLDLAGFRIRYGAKYGTYTGEFRVDNAGATSQRVGGLRAGLHYFVVSAVDREGQEGPVSKPQRIQVN